MIRFDWKDLIERCTPSPKVEEEPDVVVAPPVDVVVTTPIFEWTDLKKELRTKSRGKSKGTRKWTQITGITLHQTAVDFGINPRRILNLPVHGSTLQDGHIVLLHSPTHYLWHAHSLNKTDIGIEVSCRAAGIWDDPTTLKDESKWTLWLPKILRGKGDPRDHAVEATDEQLEATKQLCRYYIKTVKEHGGEIKFIHAHRQGHSSRISDPGSRIWQLVAIPIMEEFGLTPGPDVGWKIGSGTPLPQVWDEEYGAGARYNWRVKGF